MSKDLDEKSAKSDKDEESRSDLGLFRCRPLDLYQVITDKKELETFKREIYFKYIFLVGGTTEIFESQVMNKFLQVLMEHKMKPFAVFLVRNTATRAIIEAGAYKHLIFNKLPLFPNIIVKRTDLEPKVKKKKFKLMLCRS